MELPVHFFLPAWDYLCVLQEKFPQKSYNKSFIDQVCLVEMAGYWPSSFFNGEFMDLDSISVHKHTKKELGQYPAILTSRLDNNPYILPAWAANHSTGFNSSCLLTELAIQSAM